MRLAEKTKSQVVVTNTSVGIAVATFVGVLVYHTYQQLWPKLEQRIHHLRHCKEHQREIFDEGDIKNQRQISTLPTVTIVEHPSPEPLNSTNVAKCQQFKQSSTVLREPLLLSDTSTTPGVWRKRMQNLKLNQGSHARRALFYESPTLSHVKLPKLNDQAQPNLLLIQSRSLICSKWKT